MMNFGASPICRRGFLSGVAAAAAMLTVRPLTAQSTGVRRYAITAAAAAHRLGKEGAPSTDLWLYDGTSPGPMIRARRGDTGWSSNNLEVPTTMHCTAFVISTRWMAYPT